MDLINIQTGISGVGSQGGTSISGGVGGGLSPKICLWNSWPCWSPKFCLQQYRWQISQILPSEFQIWPQNWDFFPTFASCGDRTSQVFCLVWWTWPDLAPNFAFKLDVRSKPPWPPYLGVPPWELGISELPKNTLPLIENPKNYCSKSKTLKIPSKNTIHLAKVKHDMIIMDNRDYWSTRCMKLDPKNTVKNMKHLKIQHLSNNPKNTAAVSCTPKNTDFRNWKPIKYTLLIPVCRYAKSTLWGRVFLL